MPHTSAKVMAVSTTRLRLRESFTLPVEADNICPDRFAGLSQEEVAALPLLFGRRHLTVGDLFTVEGDGAEDQEQVPDEPNRTEGDDPATTQPTTQPTSSRP